MNNKSTGKENEIIVLNNDASSSNANIVPPNQQNNFLASTNNSFAQVAKSLLDITNQLQSSTTKRPLINQNNNRMSVKTPRNGNDTTNSRNSNQLNSRPNNNTTATANNNNSNHNKNLRQNSSAQKSLLNFDSQAPNAPNTNIPKENPWRLAGKVNKAKHYLKAIGTNSNNALETVDRPFAVYIGRLSNNTNKDQVVDFLKTIFKSNIGPINEVEHNHKWFKSYWVNVNYLERELIYNKDLWPSGCVVDRYRKPRTNPATIPSANNTLSNQAPNTIINNNELMQHEQTIATNGSTSQQNNI